ncbi:Phosphatidylinositol 3- and 4-kinase family protein [Trichomonas vaginalis G3]|uniref:phosphatidylinositol 3-kinase n=1 Tax=Trichomonas vaginalis (strain ATCC PRA-98 / G3) TaxID=412133 RepID=A2FTE2_TRIV3|nr:Class III phosphoinositide 3-kinase catalytic domain-containing protein [Trichomonas vaginalis G3]EAX91827.1 Phosphatidylinositol 3- and 4-kinase family protein [Trichomonas vaginalis G3]KAI5520246.1 Class III phosphoinositide 3-kinase catalytic domain-containing protein [Trichomonas vaginalis G3]|eukprot:XP_001304757.1 Phosphatidylinositol 3- and 4-kinase family protein [Trichomonas vaginalis G3]
MQSVNVGLSKTANYGTNVKIMLKNLTVDVDSQLPFDIYHYFQISPPISVIGQWDTKNAIPFIAEAECLIVSKGKPLTCPIILQSQQYTITKPKIPELVSGMTVLRKQFVFEWNRNIEFPIYYSELPVDSIVVFKFYAKLFQTESKFIGKTQLHIFTRTKTPRLRLGFFPLVFDGTPPTKLSKHIRRLYTGKDPEYKYIDTQLKSINASLHPTDAKIYYRSILTPSNPPKLSRVSQFAQIYIESPCSDPTTLIIHDGIMLPTSKSPNSLNPSQRLYHDLTHSTSGFKSSFLKDSKVTKILNKVKSYGPLVELQPMEVNCLYNNFRACLQDQALMPALFRAVNWENKDERVEIEQMLKDRDPIDAEYALEFFTDRYNIQSIRQFAVKCISAMKHEDILLYLPQILQATKVQYTEGLVDILVNNALGDPIFASTLYWNAQVEKEQFSVLLEKLTSNLTGEVKQQLEDEIDLYKRLYNLLQNHPKATPAVIRDTIRDLLNNDPVHSQLKSFKPTRLPLDPSLFVVGIDTSDVKVFKSKLCPVCLCFKLQNGGKYRAIFKIGDDMRQDQLILQLFEVMAHIFKAASMQLNITAYKTLAFSETFGCCQFIDNSRAILDIAKDGMNILQFLANPDGTVDSGKIDIFTESLAAYSVMTYVLKIGDRHDNNILVTKDGRLLHIDYGFILGDVTKPFTPPLKLSKEMIETIGANGMQRLCDWACPAFNSLRKRARLILVLIELMFTAPLECFQNNPKRRLQQVENCLLLRCTEIEASKSLQATFTQSLNSKMQVFWDAVHTVAVSTNGQSAEK